MGQCAGRLTGDKPTRRASAMSRPSRSSSSVTRRPIDHVDDQVGDQPRRRPTSTTDADAARLDDQLVADRVVGGLGLSRSRRCPAPPRPWRGEHAGQQRAQDTADAVHAEHVERVVGAEHASSGRSRPRGRPRRPTMPITIAPVDADEAAAGVIATRPATAPDAAPSIDGLPLNSHSANIHDSTAAAVATSVLTNASAGDAARLQRRTRVEAEPADPQQRRADHRHRQVVRRHRLPGRSRRACRAKYAPTSPAIPALMCTTVPPAKSSAPFCHSQPPLAVADASVAASLMPSGPGQNQTMCAIGDVAEREPQHHEQQHRRELHALGERADDQAAVIAANVAWNADVDVSRESPSPC